MVIIITQNLFGGVNRIFTCYTVMVDIINIGLSTSTSALMEATQSNLPMMKRDKNASGKTQVLFIFYN